MSHPIENIMQTTMNELKSIIDVNTIIGSPVNTGDSVIVPVSKVSFGFVSGGGEYGQGAMAARMEAKETAGKHGDKSFAGGSGAGVSLNPVAFLVIHGDNVKLLPVTFNGVLDRVIENIPEYIEEIKGIFSKCKKADPASYETYSSADYPPFTE